MKEWTLHISYHLKQYKLRAVLEYHSTQIMRIRVYGTKTELLLESNYPIIQNTKNTRGMKWKLREGAMTEGTPESSSLMYNIMQQLEAYIKKDFPPNPYLF